MKSRVLAICVKGLLVGNRACLRHKVTYISREQSTLESDENPRVFTQNDNICQFIMDTSMLPEENVPILYRLL